MGWSLPVADRFIADRARLRQLDSNNFCPAISASRLSRFAAVTMASPTGRTKPNDLALDFGVAHAALCIRIRAAAVRRWRGDTHMQNHPSATDLYLETERPTVRSFAS